MLTRAGDDWQPSSIDFQNLHVNVVENVVTSHANAGARAVWAGIAGAREVRLWLGYAHTSALTAKCPMTGLEYNPQMPKPIAQP